MRGAVPAGMCLVLEAAGLIPSFDRIYGCSSGALAGCFAAAGQAALWATSFEDAACRAFIDPRRALRRRPVLDLGYLFDTVSSGGAGRSRRTGSRAGRSCARSPSRSATPGCACSRASTAPARALAARCGRAARSAAGRARRERLPRRAARRRRAARADPVSAARCARAPRTCSVLRSRPAGFRIRPGLRPAELAVARVHPELAPLLRGSHASLQRPRRASSRRCAVRTSGGAAVSQIGAPAGARLVGRLSVDAGRVARQPPRRSGEHGGRALRRAGPAAAARGSPELTAARRTARGLGDRSALRARVGGRPVVGLGARRGRGSGAGLSTTSATTTRRRSARADPERHVVAAGRAPPRGVAPGHQPTAWATSERGEHGAPDRGRGPGTHARSSRITALDVGRPHAAAFGPAASARFIALAGASV